ncbi:MAG: hypothetical protein A2Y14_00835 [Verrucomicrobia bacterium GWF2_51_19]|nr:MAG: hypothetical protein A2Y14_00835 [Verrucomicrobia bacterium GWF2_51_19]HAD82588.1 ATP-binding protein [Candidatus Edwardsbacteria bacterium]
MILLEYKNKIEELNRLNGDLQVFCAQYSVDAKIRYSLLLCLDEIFTNIVSYAFKDKQEHSIHLTLDYVDSAISIQIEDDGAPFDPIRSIPRPKLSKNIDDIPIGGLGIFLVEQLMDGLAYTRLNDKNVLCMRKRVVEFI